MEEKLTIRSCTTADAPAILSLAIKTFRATFDDVNTPENMMMYINEKFTLKKIREELDEPGSVFFIAEVKNRPIGYARLRTSVKLSELGDAKAMEIERLYTDSKFIGKGVGYALMKTCLEYARSKNVDIIWLGVWEHNQRAIDFYKKIGFEKFSHHVFMLGTDPQIDHLMKLKLNA